MEDIKEEYLVNQKNYKKILTEKGKYCYIESDKYILYFNNKNAKDELVYRCKFYKNKEIRCKGYAIFDKNEKLKSFNNQHSCVIDSITVKKMLLMNEAKTTLDKNSDIYNIKARDIYEKSLKKITKRKKDELQDEDNNANSLQNIDLKQNSSPNFDNIKHNIYRYINKNIPKDIESLEDLPEESDFYNTIKGDTFLIYKTISILIFMSIIQARLLYTYNEHVFIDGTFFVAPKAAYQVIVIRVHNIIEDRFHTVCYGILTNKEMSTYVEFFEKIKEYIYANRENKRILEEHLPLNIHIDFEIGLIGAIKQCFPNTDIKLCLWHFFRNIEINRKKIYGDINNQNQISLNILKRIKTLCYIDPKYVRKVFDMILDDAENSNEDDIQFVKIYFKKNYIDKFNYNDWNYYKCYDHRTNNSCESYNHVLNSKFSSKPTFWKFISILKQEEYNLNIELENIKNGNIKYKKRGVKSFESVCKKYYDDYDLKISNILNSDSNNKEDQIIMLWYNACLDFPLYNDNL